MPEIIVIGAGISGLSAAWQLRQLGIETTLIEVRPRLGGSIHTVRAGGCIFDGPDFAFEKTGAWPFLEALGLPEADALLPLGRYRTGEMVAFREGTGVLVERLAAAAGAHTMMRMAVSSLGMLDDGHVAICLENGVMLEAQAVVIAAPARYAERMLRAIDGQAALALADFRYDPLLRVSVALAGQDAPPALLHELAQAARTAGMALVSAEAFNAEMLPGRVPPGEVMLRLRVRLAEGQPAQDAADAALALLGGRPVLAQSVVYWAEADPLDRYLPEHSAVMDAIEARLPARLALVGSDYRVRQLDALIAQARAAAARLAALVRGAGGVGGSP